MVVYIETNFLLEVAFQHGQHASCQRLLALAEAGKIELVLPAFSLTEPYETLIRREQESRELAEKMTAGLRQLGRAVSTATIAAEALRIPELLNEVSGQNRARLREVQSRLVRVATVIAQDAVVVEAAFAAEQRFNLSPQDAVVFASILSHLEQAPAGEKLFLELDAHFRNPDVLAELQRLGCLLRSSFDDGLQRVAYLLRS